MHDELLQVLSFRTYLVY